MPHFRSNIKGAIVTVTADENPDPDVYAEVEPAAEYVRTAEDDAAAALAAAEAAKNDDADKDVDDKDSDPVDPDPDATTEANADDAKGDDEL